ncbi:MAG: GEVED domain-containing protein [Bacteroidetes bacterium]|nr:GEVED domain-containing protein [Bacteroidota bacterium]
MKKFLSVILLLLSILCRGQQQAGLVQIVQPSSGCNLSTEPVTIRIINPGLITVTGGYTATYQLLQTMDMVTETINEDILPGDTLVYSFSAPVDLSTFMDTIYDLKIWIAVAGDADHSDDTLVKQVWSNVSPAPPTDTSFCVKPSYETHLSVHATSDLPVSWYHTPGDAPFHTGPDCEVFVLSVPVILYLNVTGTNGCPSVMVSDTITFCTDTVVEGAVQALVSPVSGQGANNPVTVSFLFKNLGNQRLTGFSLGYRINNAQAVYAIFTNMLETGQSAIYNFSLPESLSGSGYDEISVWIAIPGDQTTSNDTLTCIIHNPVNEYCASYAYSTENEDIGNVTISNLLNGSPDSLLNNPDAIHTYTDFTSLGSILLKKGQTYPISVTQISSAGFQPCMARVYADWNMDGLFDPVNELAVTLGPSPPMILTGTVEVPVNAITGLTRIRIVLYQTSDSSLITPCVPPDYNYGETEDYQALIQEDSVNISGTVTYKNSQPAVNAIKKAIVSLYCQNILIIRDTTDNTGHYQFRVPANNQYSIRASKKGWWGGGAATDALAILKHFVGLSLLQGLNKEAGDVNANGYLNSVDARMVSIRFVGQIDSFPSGDWLFEKPQVTVGNTDVIVNFKGICFGDVNGSFNPYY